MIGQLKKLYTVNARTSQIMEKMKNLVLLSLEETSRSTFPLQASNTIGTMGSMTMITRQSRMDERGSRIGPSPIGDATEKMIPT
jgi:hypothetical protein